MDNLTYNYNKDGNGNLLNNKLRHVIDPVPASAFDEDLDSQPTDNYTYDKIGNLISDKDPDPNNRLLSVKWTPYGKIGNIEKTNNIILYQYDAAGNRVWKSSNNAEKLTFYIRDPLGNILAVYDYNAPPGSGGQGGTLKWKEQHLYGSQRLGLWNPNIFVTSNWQSPAIGNGAFIEGEKTYELGNHLGNIIVTISDKKVAIDQDGNGTNDYYKAELLSVKDYYSFGMQMPGRKWSLEAYRFGFNGKENDNEVKGGDGLQQDYGMRVYDSKLSRFLSIDPLTAHYPWYTPYQFAGNKPIQYVDLDGAEETLYGLAQEGFFGKTGSKIVLGTVDGINASLSKTWSFISSDMWKANTWKKAANALGTLADITIGNMDGKNDQMAYDVIQPKIDNFKSEVINGDAYSRSKYFSEIGTDILTAYIGSKGLTALKSTAMGMVRGNLAASFYARSGFTAESALSHMEGIDFTKAVQTTTLKKGTILQQWVGKNGVGNYFTTLENGTAKNLGINYEGRTLQQFTLTEDVNVLKSTAAEYKRNAGGGTQFFSTELKSKVVPVTQTP